MAPQSPQDPPMGPTSREPRVESLEPDLRLSGSRPHFALDQTKPASRARIMNLEPDLLFSDSRLSTLSSRLDQRSAFMRYASLVAMLAVATVLAPAGGQDPGWGSIKGKISWE